MFLKLSNERNGDLIEELLKFGVAKVAPVVFLDSGATITFDAPAVDSKGIILSFELTVSDGHGNSDTSSTVLNVTKAKETDDGGSMGWMALMLLPFAWMRRKFKA